MSWIDIVLSMAVLYCVYTDIKTRKIRNYITFPLMGVGLIYNIFVAGLDGAIFSLKGMLLCGGLTLLLFFVKGFGMGDVKLFMAIGSVKGSVFSFAVIVYSLFASVVLSFLFSPRRFVKAIKNIYGMAIGLLYRNPYMITKEESALAMPYAVSIMCGLILTYVFGGEMLWSTIFGK